jgi:hypothetical protein
MQFSLKPDFEQVEKRYDAFWHREIIDRPPVNIVLPLPSAKPLPTKSYASQRERWLDIEFRAEMIDRSLRNYNFLADSLPVAWPNLGPEIFSAWCGCGYEFGEDTAWSEPCVMDWDRDADKAVFDPKHPLFLKTVEFTKLLLDYGVGHYIVGMTDLHPGADHIAALRDPQTLAMDMMDNPEHVKAKLAQSSGDYYKAYDMLYEMLRAKDMPITSWTPLIHRGKFYIPSNDFSCMISNEMFQEFFLPGLIEECRFYDRSIYHLDGPGALRHLDTLLEIKELDAIQWVCGAGNEGFRRWVKVYQKIQSKGKSMQLIDIHVDELPLVFETLRPEGVWSSGISGIDSQDTADRVIQRITKWA